MPNWIGDAVMATPALQNLINLNPKSQIILVLSPACFDLFVCNKQFICYKDESKTSNNRLLYYMKLVKTIYQEQDYIDISIAFTNSFSSRFMLWLLKSKQNIALRRYQFEPFLTKAINVYKNQHQVQIYNDLINKVFGAQLKPKGYYLETKANFKLAAKTIAIAPGASFGTAKCWEAQSYADFCSQLMQNNEDLSIAILGGSAEAKVADNIIGSIEKKIQIRITNLCGKTSLQELIAVLQQIKLLVCNDSGIMHMAAAFDTPTIAIFGPTKAWQTYAWQNPNYILIDKKLDCAPCMQRTCPLIHHNCMRNISVDEVLAASKRFLDK